MAEQRPSRRAEPLLQLLGEDRPLERSRLLFPQDEDERSQRQREEMRYRPWHAIAPPQREIPDLLPALRPQRASSRSFPLLVPLRTEDELPQRSWTVRNQRRPTFWPEASSPQRILLQTSQRASQRLLMSPESRTIRRPSARPGMRFSRSPQLIRAMVEEPRPQRRLVLLLPMREEAWFPQRLVLRFPREEDGMPQQPAMHFRLMNDNDFPEEAEVFPEREEERRRQQPVLHMPQVAEEGPGQRRSPGIQRMEDEMRELPREPPFPLIEEERQVRRQQPNRYVPDERPRDGPPFNIQWVGGEMRGLPEELLPLVADRRRPPSPAPHIPLMPDDERPPSPAPHFPRMPNERRPQRPAPHFPLMVEERGQRRPVLRLPLLEDERRPADDRRRPALHEAFPWADEELPEELAALFPRERRPQRPALNIPFIPDERRPERPPVNAPPMAEEMPQAQPAPNVPLEEEERPAQRPVYEAQGMPRLWHGIRRPRRPGPALLPVRRPPPWPPPFIRWINLLLHRFITLLKVGVHRVYPATRQDGSQSVAVPAAQNKVRPKLKVKFLQVARISKS